MMLVFLVLVLASLPLLFSSSFTHLALVSTYAGLAHLAGLGVLALIIRFSLRWDAICRALRQKSR